MAHIRRFKALNNMGTDYVKIVEKIAVYDNNGNQIDCSIIRVDNEGREYYYPHNPNDKFGSFTHKVKDAIECIRNDFGDVLQKRTMFSAVTEIVIRYIDREYGEHIREQMLEGWKDAEFEYAISINLPHIMRNTMVLSKDDTVYDMAFSGTENMKTFQTEDDAKSYIDTLWNKSKEYFEEYNNIVKYSSSECRDADIKIFINNIEGYKDHNRSSIYFRLVDAMINSDGDRTNIAEIIQTVKQ